MICNEQNMSAAANMGWRLSFRRWLSTGLMELWCGLVNILNQVTLTDGQDENGQRMVNFLSKVYINNYAEMVLTYILSTFGRV
jgi:hypothetical protein